MVGNPFVITVYYFPLLIQLEKYGCHVHIEVPYFKFHVSWIFKVIVAHVNAFKVYQVHAVKSGIAVAGP